MFGLDWIAANGWASETGTAAESTPSVTRLATLGVGDGIPYASLNQKPGREIIMRVAANLIVTCCLVFGLSAWVAAANEPLRTPGDRPVDIEHIRLDLEVFLEEQRIAGTASLDFTALRKIAALNLDAVDFEVGNVFVEKFGGGGERTRATYENTGTTLGVTFPEPLEKGATRRIVVEYKVRNPKAGLHFFKPSESEPEVRLMVWSQGEPIQNRYWIPCLDHPNERQTTEIFCTAANGFEVISNGKLISREPLPDGRRTRFHWKQAKPHVAYLVTLVVGKFDTAEEKWRGRPVTYYAPPGRGKDISGTFGRTLEMLDFFTEKFGVEYPWEKYAQVVVEQFTSGGMENTSATTLVDTVMHDERALIDSTPDWLIAHELAHQWWGNLVTCKDWSHLWLNEGFASYSEILWAEHKLGRDEAHYELMKDHRRARTGAALTRPIVDRRYVDPGAMFDERSYPKGAWTLHMLRHRVGDAEFLTALKRFATAYAYRTAESSDLRIIFEDLTGVALERFFHDWTERAGHPAVNIASSYSPQDKLMKIVIRQTQETEPFEFPLTIELLTGGTPMVLNPLVNQKEMTLFVPVPNRPVGVRVDPEFTLLADLTEDKPNDWWQHQLLQAGSIWERIRATEHLGKSTQPADREWLIKSLTTDPFYGVRVEAATALGKSRDDISRDALIAALGQESAYVRRAAAEALAAWVHDGKVLAALKKAASAGDKSYYVEAALVESIARVQGTPTVESIKYALDLPSHRECIRQAALQGLALSREKEALDLLIEWTKRGKPRDCRRTALRCLGTYFSQNEVPTADTQRVVELLISNIQNEGPAVREGSAEAFRELGQAGRPSIDLLTSLSQHDPNRRVRAAARLAVEKLKSNAPSNEELSRLRNLVDELRKERQTLEERLLRLEAK
jgi:aminopeptidase N